MKISTAIKDYYKIIVSNSEPHILTLKYKII